MAREARIYSYLHAHGSSVGTRSPGKFPRKPSLPTAYHKHGTGAPTREETEKDEEDADTWLGGERGGGQLIGGCIRIKAPFYEKKKRVVGL